MCASHISAVRTREKGCKSVNEVKKISHRPKTLKCVKKSCVYRWQSVYEMQGICDVKMQQQQHCSNTSRDLSTAPIPQKGKEHDAGEKIHIYVHHEDSWQPQTHNTSTAENFNGNYFHHGDYFSRSLSCLLSRLVYFDRLQTHSQS